MSEAEVIDLLRSRFYDRFADAVAAKVLAADAVGTLYGVATSRHGALPKAVRHQVLFRAAYVLERIYFEAPAQFLPWADDFCRRAYPECCDASAKRCFGKVMSDLLGHFHPETQVLERIAECAADWAVDPQSKVAVRVWAVEVLKRCRGRVDWVAEAWADIVETQAYGATPGILSRMRTSWQR